MIKKKINTILIGLGKIGLEYDLNSKKFLTFSKVISSDKRFDLICAVDPNLSQQKKFRSKYRCDSFSNISLALKNYSPELAIISTPTNKHLISFEKIVNCNTLKYIIIEKPGTYNSKDLEKIIKICKKKKIKLFVNYNRSFDEKGRKKILKLIGSKNLIVIIYNRGLFNNCSHFISLFSSIFNFFPKIKILNKGKNFLSDPQPDFRLSYKSTEVIFINLQLKKILVNKALIFSKNFQLFSDDIFEKINILKSKHSDLIKGHYMYKDTNKLFALNTSLKQVLDKVYEYENFKLYNKKNLNNYLKTLRILEKIKFKSK